MEYKFLSKNEDQFDYYKYLEGFTHEKVDEIRLRLMSKELVPAKIDHGAVDPRKRRTKIYWLPRTEEFADVYSILFDLVRRCNESCYKFNLTEFSEFIQYTVYESSEEGYYDWHIDVGKGLPRRKLSVVVQLSDPSEYEGGELQIQTGNVRTLENMKGAVLIFPSYILHRVTPVTKGVRRSLVLWVDGPPFT